MTKKVIRLISSIPILDELLIIAKQGNQSELNKWKQKHAEELKEMAKVSIDEPKDKLP